MDKTVDSMRGHAWNVLDAAWAAGLRYFDAARSYGRAEEFLGGWLAERGHTATVGSKWGYTYVANWRTDADTHEVKSHDLKTLERQWPETLEALVRKPDLYLIHSATLETGVLEDVRVLARLAELTAMGLRVGLSTSGPGQADTLRRALAVTVDGVNPFNAVQATWNLREQSAGKALAEAHAAGWAVVVKEAVANGRLTGRGQIPSSLAEVCRELNASPDAVALAAALAQPWADVVLSGATTVEQLESNLRALELKADFPALADLAELPEVYWRARAGLAWN
ncbi:General stress protein 69 [Deinococcus saxicola]|uniref:aldo/keto reductase n=1 Tax=Deinococcus saxicola TaxID=249406 RepID=UPI0039F059BD